MARRTIGRLAREAGVKVATVRFYERKDLLERPPRAAGGSFREYPGEAVERLRFIRRAKELGFTLAEVRELLDLFDDPDTGCADVKARAEEKLEDVRARLRDLEKVQQALEGLVGACLGEGPAAACPILHALDGAHGGDS